MKSKTHSTLPSQGNESHLFIKYLVVCWFFFFQIKEMGLHQN